MRIVLTLLMASFTLARYYGEAGKTAIRLAVMHEEMANRAK